MHEMSYHRMDVRGTDERTYEGRVTLCLVYEMSYYKMGVRGISVPEVTYLSRDM